MKSLGVLILFALILSKIFKKINLPGLIGMMLAGLIMGPSGFNIIDEKVLDLSQTLRTISLIMILTRAGLMLDMNQLKENKKQVLLLSFLPATFEMLGFTFFAHLFYKLPILDSLLIGSMLSAVSPAVIVPRMIKIKEEGYAEKSGVADMVLAGSSMDDVFVIVVFTSVLAMLKGGNFSGEMILSIPISIILGLLVGVALGKILALIIEKIEINAYIVGILYSVSFILLSLEENINFSALISIITIGAMIKKELPKKALELSGVYKNMWFIGEIVLFSLLGTSINIKYISQLGSMSLILIFLALIIRMFGVIVSLYGSSLNRKEKLFVVLSYLPKATVQAAIGGIPLAEGLAIGPMVLSFAVLSIVITAPLGAILIDKTYKKLLT